MNAWPFLLDKVAESDPEGAFHDTTSEFPACGSAGLTEGQFRGALLRDIERLLNTLRVPMSHLLGEAAEAVEIGSFEHVPSSTICYGLASPRGGSIAGKVETLRQAIEEAIRFFEPRLDPDSLLVSVMENDGASERMQSNLRFRVEGTVMFRRVPEHLEFSLEANLTEQRNRILA